MKVYIVLLLSIFLLAACTNNLSGHYPKGDSCTVDSDCVCTRTAPDSCGETGEVWKCVESTCQLELEQQVETGDVQLSGIAYHWSDVVSHPLEPLENRTIFVISAEDAAPMERMNLSMRSGISTDKKFEFIGEFPPSTINVITDQHGYYSLYYSPGDVIICTDSAYTWGAYYCAQVSLPLEDASYLDYYFTFGGEDFIVTSRYDCQREQERFVEASPWFFEDIDYLDWCSECVNKYGMPTLSHDGGPFCNLRTSDDGKICKDSGQCQGFCLANNESGTSGRCTEYEQLEDGCWLDMVNGKVAELCVS